MNGPSKTVRQTAPLESGAKLSVHNHKGSLRLTPWEREEVEIEARIEAPEYLDAEEAAQLVEATRIEVKGGASGLTVDSDSRRASAPRGSESAPAPLVHYAIRAPRALRLTVQDHESDVEIGGFAGAVEIATHKGSVRLAGFCGELEVSTHKGTIELSNVAVEGGSRVQSYKGSVSIGLVPARGLSLVVDLAKKAVFQGDLEGQVRRQVGGRLESSVAGGGPKLRIESQSGEVRLSCPRPEGVLV